MSKISSDIELLKSWARWVEAESKDELLKDAADSVMKVIAYVGTLEAQLRKKILNNE